MLSLLWNGACVADIRQWLTQDKLLMNDDKTGFIVIGQNSSCQR
jgi:hypothetical protein